MIRRLAVTSLLIVCFGMPWGAYVMGESPVVNPSALSDLEFRFVGTDGQREYLGIGPEAKLSLGGIKADYLIVAVFNYYCTICQEDAAYLNLVYELIEDNVLLKGRTKIVGVAPGNTDAEVEHYRDEYQVPFPLFADAGFALDRAVPKNLRAPMLITLRNNGGKAPEVVKSHSGRIEKVEDVLNDILRSAMLKSTHVMVRQSDDGR
ncbi:MAG: hypothetical protein RDU20_06870 [Desulfomonilaceae bacterium]|nr:hypothetical protein [Desulfomonilaceae bacterium]